MKAVSKQPSPVFDITESPPHPLYSGRGFPARCGPLQFINAVSLLIINKTFHYLRLYDKLFYYSNCQRYEI